MLNSRCLGRRLILAVAALAVTLAPAGLASAQTSPTASASAADQTGRDRLIVWLTNLARRQTDTRRQTIAALTSDEARLRQVRVHALLSEMIGFETAAGPVISQTTGVSHENGFSVERIRYQSLPNYWVTADVYVPTTPGVHPAIIVQPGHGLDGKIGNYGFSANFARAGFVVLAIDIVGEGERIQHFDPEIGSSKVGRPTGEHSMAFEQALPTGGHVSRFFIQDAVRGVDYLMSRPDVDDQRIGAFGCSGGGTITAYLAALDPRIRATATACYTNTFDEILAPGGPGPQDAEQSIPFFLERGLDLPDWIESVAPRPYAVVATTADMFPIRGARAAYEEARRFYGLMGAQDNIRLIEGPGGHGNLGPIAAQIVAFFTDTLMGQSAERPFVAFPLGDPSRLEVTSTGQLSTAPEVMGGETIQTLALVDTAPPVVIPDERPAERLARLRAAITDIARISVMPGQSAPMAVLAPTEISTGYALTPVAFRMAVHADDPGLSVKALFATASAPGRHPTLLLLTSQPPAALRAPGGLFETWTQAGWNVLWLEPRGAGGTEEVKSPLTGDWTLLSLRALLVGKTPVGMRSDDAVAAIDWLVTRPEVDAGRLSVTGVGALGPVALHVAVLDDRIGAVGTDASIISYREFVERPISLNMAEVNLPGVLTKYDLPDLISVLGDRLTLVNPVNSIGEPLTTAEVTARAPSAARIILRGPRDQAAPPSVISTTPRRRAAS
ncbi:alpha/beta hydrolase family protein [soil metagenome]